MKRCCSPSKSPTRIRPKFNLGRLRVTPGALHEASSEEITEAIARHLSGDWGELCKEDWAENESSLATSGRLLSRYYTEDGTLFWVITECDRSATTVLLPNEY